MTESREICERVEKLRAEYHAELARTRLSDPTFRSYADGFQDGLARALSILDVLPHAQTGKDLAATRAVAVAELLSQHVPRYEFDGCHCGDESVSGWDEWLAHVTGVTPPSLAADKVHLSEVSPDKTPGQTDSGPVGFPIAHGVEGPYFGPVMQDPAVPPWPDFTIRRSSESETP